MNSEYVFIDEISKHATNLFCKGIFSLSYSATTNIIKWNNYITLNPDETSHNILNFDKARFIKECGSISYALNIYIDVFIQQMNMHYTTCKWHIESDKRKSIHVESFNSEFKNSNRILLEVETQFESEIYNHMTSVWYGMDLRLITTLSGEKYEASAASGMGMTVIPEEILENLDKQADSEEYPCKIPSSKPLSSPYESIHLFNKSAWCNFDSMNIHALRKLMNIAKGEQLLIISAVKDDNGLKILKAVGFGDRSILAPIFGILELKGHMQWWFMLPHNKKQYKDISRYAEYGYTNGHICIPPIDLTKPGTNTISEYLFKHSPKGIYKKQCNTKAHKLMQFIKELVKQEHGTSLVVLSSDIYDKETAHLIDCNRGYEINPCIDLDDLSNNSDLLHNLTSIDGCLFVDIDRHLCGAFAVIVDGCALSKGDRSRGARYNSFHNYMEILKHRCDMKKRGSLGMCVIVSEDGMLDLDFAD